MNVRLSWIEVVSHSGGENKVKWIYELLAGLVPVSDLGSIFPTLGPNGSVSPLVPAPDKRLRRVPLVRMECPCTRAKGTHPRDYHPLVAN